MPKMVYIGPGTGQNKKTVEVRAEEVKALEKTKLWKRKSSKAEAENQKPEGKEKDNG